jgi:hypothetical protein
VSAGHFAYDDGELLSEVIMALLDHFAPDADLELNWESFHSTWANTIRNALRQELPKRFVALVNVHLGTFVATDVAEYDRLASKSGQPGNGDAGAGGVALKTWAPPAARMLMPAVFPDDLEVQVFDTRGGARLVAVIELVSPSNKDRDATRRAFAAKSAAFLQRGLGLIVVDVVTGSRHNLHTEMVRLMDLPSSFEMPADATLYAVAYRPISRAGTDQIEVWPEALAVGGALPVLPLALRGTMTIPVDLDATYTQACQWSGL